ncbi:hypothetical protein EDC96DRAFT_613129 [Choanephora cucurbitarum]|nr:hypothetical protein EDC96DRAFT_613129 [Choanephora cucurbitarum]
MNRDILDIRSSCFRTEDLERLEVREAPASGNVDQRTSIINPASNLNSLIYRPQISGGSEKKLKQKLDYFTQQWLGDAVIVNVNDGKEARREKESLLDMYESSLRQFGKIAVEKSIKKLQVVDKEWRDISYSKLDPDMKQECFENLRSLALNNNIPTSRCVEFWLEKALVSYLYHNKARRTRSEVSKPDQQQSQPIMGSQVSMPSTSSAMQYFPSSSQLPQPAQHPLPHLSSMLPIMSSLTAPSLQMPPPTQPASLSPSLASLPAPSLPSSSANSPIPSSPSSMSSKQSLPTSSPPSAPPSAPFDESMAFRIQYLERQLSQLQSASRPSRLPQPPSSSSSQINRDARKKR